MARTGISAFGWFRTATLLVAIAFLSPAWAQPEPAGDVSVFPNLSLGNFGEDDDEDEHARFTADYFLEAEGRGTLRVTAKIKSGWHVYSVTQPAGGPLPTKLEVTGPSGVRLDGDFKPDRKPKVASERAWPGLPIEKHEDRVTWSAPVEIPQGFDEPIDIRVSVLACKTDGSCVPINSRVQAARTEAPAGQTAQVAAAAEVETPAVEPFRNARSVVEWTGHLVPAKAAPGSRVTLRLTAAPDEGYHVYASAVDDSESRTNFVITEKSGLKVGPPRAPVKPIVKTPGPGQPPVAYHEGRITWSLPVEISEDAAAGTKQIHGMIGYQACTDTSCMPPKAVAFTAELEVVAAAEQAAGSGGSGGSGVEFASASYPQTMDAAAETRWVDRLSPAPDDRTDTARDPAAAAAHEAYEAVAELDERIRDVDDERRTATTPGALIVILAMAMVGGLILNLMPCVLPVVGLKIMSFASQAGEDRGKILTLNVAYTVGILVVFWALAALAVISTYSWGREWLGLEGQLSWGQQFQLFEFRYAVILLVFALALSFLGVWEIPLPGFVGGRSTQELQKKEGLSGAFFKGVFTTILATPCSGPLLGAVFAYTLGKPGWTIVAIFTAIGLGMALPYLVIAVFPRLIVFLPKPGAWMDTLKHLLGFLLLGTVVFVFSFFPERDRVPVFASLIAVWFGCWIIGQVPSWETLSKRLTAWLGGIGAAAAACFFAFWITAPGAVVVAWEPYNEARLRQLQSEGRTVMVDFTAKWCVNCIVNYQVALNTKKTGRLIEELDAVPMLADWTDHDESIGAKLQELDSNSIPVLAIFPGNDPGNPIVLRDLVTQGEVLAALKAAGPSIQPARSSPESLAGRTIDDRNR